MKNILTLIQRLDKLLEEEGSPGRGIGYSQKIEQVVRIQLFTEMKRQGKVIPPSDYCICDKCKKYMNKPTVTPDGYWCEKCSFKKRPASHKTRIMLAQKGKKPRQVGIAEGYSNCDMVANFGTFCINRKFTHFPKPANAANILGYQYHRPNGDYLYMEKHDNK